MYMYNIIFVHIYTVRICTHLRYTVPEQDSHSYYVSSEVVSKEVLTTDYIGNFCDIHIATMHVAIYTEV